MRQRRTGQSTAALRRACFGTLAALGFERWVLAQEGAAVLVPAAVPAVPTVAAAAPASGHETESETIRKCLADVRSEDVRRRRRAVLILGKYRAPAAVAAVLSCLRDPDDEVRRSAAVAVSEWDVIPPSAQPDLLRLLNDPNVHIRRVASSLLPEMMSGRLGLGLGDGMVLTERLLAPPGAVRPPAAASGRGNVPGAARLPSGVLADGLPEVGLRPPPDDLAEPVNRALHDPDVTVRRNVLSAARFLPAVLTRTALEPLLRDADREVRILAVQAIAPLRGEEAPRAEALAVVVSDSDTTVRREVARALGRLGASGYPGLERLATDADPGVRLRAVQELVQLQHPQGLAYLERCALDEAVAADERRGLLVYAGFYGEEARALLTRLSADRSALLRAEAIRGLGRLPTAANDGPGFLLPCLDDESPDVRRTAAQGLLRWASAQPGRDGQAQWPGVDEVSHLLASPHADVRLLAVHLAPALAPEPRLAVLTDACLDDDTPVRSEAIMHLALLGSAPALDLVARSLDDPHPDVVLAAVRALTLRPSAPSRQVLQAFHDRCADASLKAAVAEVLGEMGSGAPLRIRPGRRPSVPPGGTAPSRSHSPTAPMLP